MNKAAFIAAGMLACVSAGRADIPTFNKDVAPLLYRNCVSCHREGEVGPFPLVTYADAAKRAKQIARVTDDEVMPPWKPVPGHGKFKNARTLTEAEIKVFQDWVRGGKPEGNAADLPPAPHFPNGWHAGKPDLILTLAKPFEIPAEGPDIYVHFVFPLGFPTDRYVRGVQILPSNRRVAHHGVILLDGSGKAREQAAKHGGQWYPNFGGPGFLPRGFLPGYAPGMTTHIPKVGEGDVSLTLAKGTDLVLQMHYHPIGKATVDLPQIGIYFTDIAPKRNPAVILMADNDIDIAPGETGFYREDTFEVPVDFEVRDIWGHMHMIGRTLDVKAVVPGGRTIDLLKINDWDFNWQDTYFYQQPIVLPKGTLIRSRWSWDNSAQNPRNPNHPPARVTLGEGSADEMTGLIIGGITVRPGWEEGIFWANVIGHYLQIEDKAKKATAQRKK